MTVNSKADTAKTSAKGGSYQRNNRNVVKDPLRYKTVLCANFERDGECPYGRKCQFAHGAAEMRRRPSGGPLEASAPVPAKTRSPSSKAQQDVASTKTKQPADMLTDKQSRNSEKHLSMPGTPKGSVGSSGSSTLPSEQPSPALPPTSSLLSSPPVALGLTTVSPVLTAISPLLLPPPLQPPPLHTVTSGSSSCEDCTPTNPAPGIDWLRCNSRTGKVEVNLMQASEEDIQIHSALETDELEHLMFPFVAKQYSHPTQTVRRSISMLWADDPLDQAAEVHAAAVAAQHSSTNTLYSSAPRPDASIHLGDGLSPGLNAGANHPAASVAQQHPGRGGVAQQQHPGIGGTGQQHHHPWQPLISTWSSPPLDAMPHPSGAAASFGKLSAAEFEKENRKALSTELLQQMLQPLSIGQEINRELSFGVGGMCVRKTIDLVFD